SRRANCSASSAERCANGYASRAVRRAIRWNSDHEFDKRSLSPSPTTPRSGEGPGHLCTPSLADDERRAHPLRPRRKRHTQDRPVPHGRIASLADATDGPGEGGRTMTPVETLLARLPGVRKARNGWSARCPAHEDRQASLSIAQGHDGTALMKCH